MHAYTPVRSLESEWKVKAGDQFQPFRKSNNDPPRAIYFQVDVNKNHSRFLQCSAREEFNLFINHQLIRAGVNGTLLLDLDSLSRQYSSDLQCIIYQRRGITQLTTEIVERSSTDAGLSIIKRKGNYFLDFSIIASLLMFAYFIILIRTLPRLAVNYFNVLRLVSLQEREENFIGTRVTSTANILFYLFASLLSGLLLTVIFFYASAQTSFPFFAIDSVWDGFAQWIKWSSTIFLLLIVKLVLIYSFCGLFKITDLISFHFFNFLRLYFFLFGISAVLSLGYFILEGQSPEFYMYLMYAVSALAGLWIVLIYLKLLTKVPFRFFHLFSYLCISEIIPMVIIFKILLF